MRLWVDTDVGSDPDDAVALLCASAHPDVEVVGVSVVDDAGVPRAAIARDLVDAPVLEPHEVDETTLGRAGADALLAIGPLNNVPRMLSSGSPGAISVMGGVLRPVRHRGTVHAVEHNFGRDPVSAARVVNERDGLLLSPLDVTVRMRLDADERARLEDADPRLAPMFEAFVEWQRASGVAPEETVVCLHDPLALLALLDEGCVATERRRLVVDPDDGALRDDEAGRAHDVVVAVDHDAAFDGIVALVERGRR